MSTHTAISQTGGSEAHGVPLTQIRKWTENFEKSPSLSLAQILLTKSDPIESLVKPEALLKDCRVFNTPLKGCASDGKHPGPAMSQGLSGRCWLYATNNLIRYDLARQLNLTELKLSHTYLYIYDKMEKANWYLENILDTVDEADDSRILVELNRTPITDGAYYHMGANLLRKYGIVPEALCPEAFSSSTPLHMNSLLASKLREYAYQLRSNPDRALKDQFLREIYNILSVSLGTPPRPDQEVKWEYEDRDGKYVCWKGTPLDFYKQYTSQRGSDPTENLILVNDPRHEYGKLYTVERRGNVVGGKLAANVNAPIEDLEKAVIACIKADEPVWIGCDVLKSSSRPLGIMDLDLHGLEAAYGFKLNSTKEERLRMGDTRMAHAMVITAVHLDADGKPVRYKVENSWTDMGWFTMTAEWFREHVLQVNVPRHVAEEKYLKVLDAGDAVVLPPWDVMAVQG